MKWAMARTRDWTCLKHITWTINREYQALWKLPSPEAGLRRSSSITNRAIRPALRAVPASASASASRGYAKGAYKHEEETDGAEHVVGAGKATTAGKFDAVGEEMRTDSFLKSEVDETDGDGLIEKAKEGVKKVGEKMQDVSDYVRGGADKAEEKEGKESTMKQVMDQGTDTVDAAADTVKEAGSTRS